MLALCGFAHHMSPIFHVGAGVQAATLIREGHRYGVDFVAGIDLAPTSANAARGLPAASTLPARITPPRYCQNTVREEVMPNVKMRVHTPM